MSNETEKASGPNNPATAFPLAERTRVFPGMSLRDWFAGQCDLVPYNPAETFKDANGRYPTTKELADYISKIRHIEADAMLAERSK